MSTFPPASSSERLKIAFVCNELPPASAGGIGPYVHTIATKLSQLGHEVHIVGIYQTQHDFCFDHYRVHPLDWHTCGRALWRRRSLMQRVKIRQSLLKIKAGAGLDIVEWPDYEGLYLRPIHGVTDVLRNHGPHLSHSELGLAPSNPEMEKLELNTMRSIKTWSGVSQWFMDYWINRSNASPTLKTVIYNPVDLKMFYPNTHERSKTEILYAGSLIERKGIHNLLKASNIFLKTLPDVTLKILGRDVQRQLDTLKSIVEPQHSNRVIFGGPVGQKELADAMRTCAVFAMPSLLESFGNVWAEAMSTGAPVLGSTAAAGPEVVLDNNTGLLADPSRPEDIAQKIITLMQDPSMRNGFGANGIEHARSMFDLDKLADRTVDQYVRALENHPTTHRKSLWAL